MDFIIQKKTYLIIYQDVFRNPNDNGREMKRVNLEQFNSLLQKDQLRSELLLHIKMDKDQMNGTLFFMRYCIH